MAQAKWQVIAHSNSQRSGDIYYDPHLIYLFWMKGKVTWNQQSFND